MLFTALRPSMIRQNFPGKPHYTEKDVPDQTGKVFIVTGANGGLGKQVARILYGANATVYIASRTESKAQTAMQEMQAAHPDSKGLLRFLHLDLGDLATIKPAVEAFMRQEDKLHVLFNNAGVLTPPAGSLTAQGHELQIGTNCLGPFLLTQLLTPTLIRTVADEGAGAARVVWVSSMAAEVFSEHHGLDVAKLKDKKRYAGHGSPLKLYGNSKAGNYLHSVEYARRQREDGIISIAVNPGNLDSDLYRSISSEKGINGLFMSMIFTKFMLYPQVNGAYTELFSALSPEITMQQTGSWVGPWGRFFDVRSGLVDATRRPTGGGKSVAEEFWDWSVEETKLYG